VPYNIEKSDCVNAVETQKKIKMKYPKIILFLLSIFFVFSCSKEDDKIDFTFLQLNDVYEIAPIQGGEFGGMARVETVHQDLLKENKNTLLVMAGDFLNPSLIGTLKVEGERVRGKQMIAVMNAMNFDLVAFGNHEFDVPQKDLQKRLNESNFPWISANVKEKNEKGSTFFHKEINGKKAPLSPSFIKEFSDADGTKIKVGFISVCIPSNPKEYVIYEDMYAQAIAAYADIKDSVDVVFGLTHVKIAQDKRIAKLLPNLPLIMGGHEHTSRSVSVGNTVITKADANAKTVYIHRISYDKKTKKTTIISELKEINSTIKTAKKVGAIVEQWQHVLKTKIKEIVSNPEAIIYTSKIPLDGRDTPIRSVQTNLGDIITKSMSFAFDDSVDCAIVNGGSIRIDDALEGAITAVDIFRVLPYGGEILKVKIKGSLLKRVLDYGDLAAGTGAYLQRFHVEKVGAEWYIKNNLLALDKTYDVAFSEYLLKGFDIPFLSEKNNDVLSVYHPQPPELGFDIRKAVVSYLTLETTKSVHK
jgi:2',3'-cyclic-nucleotide 2'-phosphodiesterase (5'-nucleotidase family)